MIVYGEPESTDGSVEYTGSWDDCLAVCYRNTDCVLAFQTSNGCQMIAKGNFTVKKMESSDGKIVAFKRNITSSECPKDANPPLFTEASSSDIVIDGQTIYNSTLLFNGDTWIFTYSIQECPINSTLFIRGTVPVCIQVRLFSNPLCSMRDGTEELCSSGLGLADVYPSEIPQVIDEFERRRSIAPPTPRSHKYYNIWIWGPPGVCRLLLQDGTTDEIECDRLPEEGGYCLRGAVCQTALI